VTNRRDLFLSVAKPGKVDEALAFTKRWLSEIDGHPGYLGGSVLIDSAKGCLTERWSPSSSSSSNRPRRPRPCGPTSRAD
jgi:hypothetical protein